MGNKYLSMSVQDLFTIIRHGRADSSNRACREIVRRLEEVPQIHFAVRMENEPSSGSSVYIGKCGYTSKNPNEFRKYGSRAIPTCPACHTFSQ